jgi:hypothetical protein
LWDCDGGGCDGSGSGDICAGGGITGYFYCVIILSLSNYIYLYDKWPAYLKNGSSYNVIEYGRKLFDEKILFSNEYIDETKKKLKK